MPDPDTIAAALDAWRAALDQNEVLDRRPSWAITQPETETQS